MMKLDLTDRRRIFFCTDVHGEWDKLNFFLKQVGFNYRDAIVSAGDLIDRGSQNLEVLNFFLFTDNAYSIRGNHEQMAIEACVHQSHHMHQCWLANGGYWSEQYPTGMIDGIFELIDRQFPWYLDIRVENTSIGVVHAEVPNGDFETYKRVAGKNAALDNKAIWGRSAISNKEAAAVFGADFVLHGHSVKKQVTRIQNQIWFDTGGVFDCGSDKYALTFLEFQRDTKTFKEYRVVLDPLAGKNKYTLV